MKPGHKQYQRFAALLPVQADTGPLVTMYPITTLADDKEQATWLARDAGIVLVGQIDPNGNIIIAGP